jgi:hypothetical protein
LRVERFLLDKAISGAKIEITTPLEDRQRLVMTVPDLNIVL